MPEPVPSLLRIRVVQPYNSGNSEITSDLPHLHKVTFRVDGMQPGNPSNASLGSFTIPLHPPGSEGYAAAKPIYDLLDRFQRVELYISNDGASLGKLKYAGIVNAIVKSYGTNSRFELQGASDLLLANLSKPFPGELLSNDVTSAMLKSYLGTNELGWADTFSPFTSGNYNSTHTLGTTSGTWSGTTDDGFTVVTCSTGTGAALISKSGAAANDRWHTQYAEVTGRLSPSADASNAGRVGVGLSLSSTDLTIGNNSILASVTALKQNGRYVLTATVTVAGSTGFNVQNALTNADDPQGMIPITVGILATEGGSASANASVSVIVNGKVVIQVPCSFVPSTATTYPFLFFGTPDSGSAACYLMNLVQYTRFTADGPSTASVFAPGSISTATHSLGYGIDPGPTFLETLTKFATREGWYWRYTPQPFVVGSRTLGVIDYAPDPGVDRSIGSSNPNVVFERLINLVDLQMTANQDPMVADVAISGQSTTDGGGIGYWRDVATLQKYGVIQEEAFAFTHGDFAGLRRAAYQIVQNKITVGNSGAKIATVLRDPGTADVWRELDKVTIDDKEQGINRFTSRILGYEFTEGSATQTIYLDQFSPEDGNGPIVLLKRFQQTVFEAISSQNRFQGTGGGSGLGQPLGAGNFAAGGNQGGYSTANGSTWTDITNTSFTLVVPRASLFEYRLVASAHISAGTGTGFVRGNIVGFDATASPWFQGANVTNGDMWYYPFNKGPIQPGTYTVKLQAATSINTTTVTIDQFFHQVFLYGV